MAIQLKSQNVTNMYTPIELVTTNITIAGYGGGGGGGYTDHGYLHGLLDNDHPQYQLTASNSVILGPYQLTANNSLSLGTGATVSFEHTSQSTKFLAKSNSTLLAAKTHIHGNVSIATTSGGVVTASSASNGLTLSIPSFVTSAAASDHSHGSVLMTTTSGSDIALTSASSGMTMAVPAFLTTAYGAAIQGSGTYSQNTGTIQFSNSHGVTFGLGTDGIMTASIPAVGGAQTGISGIADSATTFIEGTLHYVNSNGIGFGLSTDGSNASLTASYTVPGATVFSNSNNIEFGLAGSTVTALANMNATSFSNSNNVSFGLSGSTITATATFAQSAQTFSDQSSNYIFSGFSSSSVHTDGIPYGLSLTATPGGNNLSLSGNNTTGTLTLVSSGTAYLAGGNNVTLSQEGNSITIIGAAQGGVQTGISGIVGSDATFSSGSVIMSGQANITIGSFATSDSQYVRFSVGNYITTGALSNHTHGSNVSTASTSGVDIKYSSSSNGLTMGIPPYITTAAQSACTSVFAKTGFSTQSTAGTDLYGTLNTNGLNVGVPKWITTGALSTHSHGNPTLSLSNLSGSTASASNGLTISLTGYPATSFVNVTDSGSVYFVNSLGSNITWGTSTTVGSTSLFATAGGGVAADWSVGSTTGTNVVISTGAATNTFYQPAFITTATGGGAGNLSVSAGTSSATLDSIVFSNSNEVSFGLNGSTITASIPPTGTVYYSDGSNVTWGSTTAANATTITASVAAPGAATNAVGLATAGTNITWTVNTNGISINNPSWLLTAAQSDHIHSDLYIPLANSTEYNTSVLSGSLMPLAYSSGFQTATLSNTFANTSHSHTNYVGLATTAITGGSLTANSSQLQVSIPQGSLYFVDGSGVSFGGSSSGLSTTITASIASYAASSHTHSDLYIPIANSTDYATSILSGTFQTTGAYLTTQSAHTNFAGILTTGITGGSATINSSQVQISMVPAGTVYFSDIAGFSFGSSTDATNTTLYLITA